MIEDIIDESPQAQRRRVIERKIEEGNPSPVTYMALKQVEIDGLVRFVDATPVHLRRSGLRF